MASTLKQLALLSLLLFLYSALQTQARDSQFFSKQVRYSAPDGTEPTARPEAKKEPIITTQMKPTRKAESENHHGFGLYGRNGLPPASTYINEEYNESNNELSGSVERSETGRYEVGGVSVDEEIDPIEMFENNEEYYRSHAKANEYNGYKGEKDPKDMIRP